MFACFRIGAVVLPCTEQLRAKDLRLRSPWRSPSLIVADERNRAELEAAGAGRVPMLFVPDEALFAAEPAPAVELATEDPCLITFTSGTAGEPKAVVHAQRYLPASACRPSTGWAPPGELVWCTAARGWSSRRATCSSRRGCRARARCCTTRASTRPSAWSCSRASA